MHPANTGRSGVMPEKDQSYSDDAPAVLLRKAKQQGSETSNLCREQGQIGKDPEPRLVQGRSLSASPRFPGRLQESKE